MEQYNRDPLYVQVHDRLLAMIQAGTLVVGQQLSSEAELSAKMGISRPTLREALRALEQDGVIVRRHGLGTFVARREPLRSGLERLESLWFLAATQGMEATVRDLAVQEIPCDESIAPYLQVPLGTLVTAVRRTLLVAGTPLSWMEDYVPIEYLTAADLDETFNGSVLDFLREQRHLRIDRAIANITAVLATHHLAQCLGVNPGAALVLIRETLVGAAGTPVGFSYNYSVPGRLDVRVVRS